MRNLLTLATEVPSIVDTQETVKEIVENPGVIKTYFANLGPIIIKYAIQIVICLIILFVGFKLINGICKLIKKAMEKNSADAGVANFVNSLVKYLLRFLLIMLLLSSFGLSGSIVAILGSAGLTIGLALQGSLANFAGGVLLVILKPFKLGDYIVDHGNGQEGTVAEISIFYTKILTIDNKMIYIPNGQISNSTITNVSRMDERRVDMSFSVAYDSDLSKVKEVLKDVALSDERVLKDMSIDVFVDELGDSSIRMGLRVWVKKADYFTTKWAIVENVKIALDEAGVSIPFPQMDVHMK